jgi:Na+/H+ antiporter NhaD/arsenite permease-like protein
MVARALKVSPIPSLMAAALLSDTGGVASLVGAPPNLMIGSANNINFNTFFYHMGGIVFLAWISILLALKFLFRKELAIKPTGEFSEKPDYHDRKLWNQCLGVLAITDSSAYNESFNPLSLPASFSSFKTLLVRSNIWRA